MSSNKRTARKGTVLFFEENKGCGLREGKAKRIWANIINS